MKHFGNDIDYQEIRKSISYKILVKDLIALGVKEDDTIMVHSSLSSMGHVLNGAITFIIALCDVVKKGTVLFPSFSYIETNKNYYYSALKSSCCVGMIPETFRKLKNVVRSFHPTHSVSAYGKDAVIITKDHILDDTPLGENSPFRKLIDFNGKILFLGCGLYCNSFIHALEEIANVSYVLGEYKTYTMVDENNNVIKKNYRVHNFNRENGNIIQMYHKTLEVLDEKDYSVGNVHNALSYLIDVKVLKEKALLKLKEDEKYFIDDPCNIL